MRIVYVWDAEYPWDVRTEKVCRGLVDAGHEVRLTARNRRRQPEREDLPEARVHRLAPVDWLGKLDPHLQFPAFFNPRWLGLIESTAREVDAQVIVVRDLPLAPSAIRVGRKLGVPVALDMAENYPAMIEDLWTTGKAGGIDHLIRNPRLVKAVERWVVPRMDHIIVVVEESKDRILPMGASADTTTVVSNTPPRSRAASASDRAISTSRLSLSYLGLMEEARGVGVLIEALALAQRAGLRFQATLIGDGFDLESFKARARELGIPDEDLTFTGYLPNPEARARVAESDVGLIPHIPYESWNTTIPNKLFDYMAAGLPVICSDARPVERVVNEVGCGLVYPGRDPRALADAIATMARSGERREMGERGRTAVLERYNWEEDMERLISALEDTVARTAGRRRA